MRSFVTEKEDGRFFLETEGRSIPLSTFSEDTPEKEIEEMGFVRLDRTGLSVSTIMVMLQPEDLWIEKVHARKGCAA